MPTLLPRIIHNYIRRASQHRRAKLKTKPKRKHKVKAQSKGMERRKEKPLLTEGMTALESLAQLQANYHESNKIAGCKINVQKINSISI